MKRKKKNRFRLLSANERAFYHELPDTFTSQLSLQLARESRHVDTPHELRFMLALFQELDLLKLRPAPTGGYEKVHQSHKQPRASELPD